jgi:hypothetical protein
MSKLLQMSKIVYLDDGRNSDKGFLERVEGRRVEHLPLDARRVRAPADQEHSSPKGVFTRNNFAPMDQLPI